MRRGRQMRQIYYTALLPFHLSTKRQSPMAVVIGPYLLTSSNVV